MIPSQSLLEEAFIHAGIPAEVVENASRCLLDDVNRFGMEDFSLGERYQTKLGPVVEYRFGETAYSIDNARPENAPKFMPSEHGGTQLDSENILFFLRVSEIARIFVPELWSKPDSAFLGKIRSPGQHLDTLNEVWWLSRWMWHFKIESNYCLTADGGPDIDWHLTWDFGLGGPLFVNLEVKRRSDVLRLCGGPVVPKELFQAGLCKNGRCKFRTSHDSEINVLAISLLGPIDFPLRQAAEEWLAGRKDIDAMLFFSRFSSGNPGFLALTQRKADFLNQVLDTKLDVADLCLHFRTSVPFSVPGLPGFSRRRSR